MVSSDLPLFLLFVAALCLDQSVLSYYSNYHMSSSNFHLSDVMTSWTEAQQSCEKNFSELAILWPGAEAHKLPELSKHNTVWIGLYRDPNNSSVWRWTGTREDASQNRNWAKGESNINWAPHEPSTADCGSIDLKTKQLYSTDCSEKLKFVCYHHNVVLVKENKTWEEALEHCRAMEHPQYGVQLYDLLSLHYSHSYSSMEIQEATTNEVWIGLRMLAGEWLQLNGRPPLTQHLPRCPAQRQHCGALSKESQAPWEARDCEERRNFLCYKNKIIVTKKNSSEDGT